MGGFSSFGNSVGYGRIGKGFGNTVAVPVQHDAVGPMPQAVQRGGAHHFVGRKGIPPFPEVQIAGEGRGSPLVAFRNEVMEYLVFRWAQGLEPEVMCARACRS